MWQRQAGHKAVAEQSSRSRIFKIRKICKLGKKKCVEGSTKTCIRLILSKHKRGKRINLATKGKRL